MSAREPAPFGTGSGSTTTWAHGSTVADLISSNLTVRADILEGNAPDPHIVEELLAKDYAFIEAQELYHAGYWRTLEDAMADYIDRYRRDRAAWRRP